MHLNLSSMRWKNFIPNHACKIKLNISTIIVSYFKKIIARENNISNKEHVEIILNFVRWSFSFQYTLWKIGSNKILNFFIIIV